MNMSKCPYCNVEIHLEDFFDVREKETKKGKLKKESETIKEKNYMLDLVAMM